jgi:hypothetical protein
MNEPYRLQAYKPLFVLWLIDLSGKTSIIAIVIFAMYLPLSSMTVSTTPSWRHAKPCTKSQVAQSSQVARQHTQLVDCWVFDPLHHLEAFVRSLCLAVSCMNQASITLARVVPIELFLIRDSKI